MAVIRKQHDQSFDLTVWLKRTFKVKSLGNALLLEHLNAVCVVYTSCSLFKLESDQVTPFLAFSQHTAM